MAEPRDAQVELRGLPFHYRDYGGEGRDVVLLHGLASNAVFWDLCAPYLTEQFRVVALDQRGHGSSAKTDDGYDTPTVAADVTAFFDSLGLNFPILVGHSWGANVAMQVAADNSGRLSGLVCIDGGTIEPSAAPGATWAKTEMELSPPDFASMNVKWEQMLERSRSRRRGLWGEDGAEAFMRANFEIQEDGTVLPRLRYDKHMLIVRAIWDQQVSNLFPKVETPVVLMPARREEEGADSAGSRSEKEASHARAVSMLQNGRLVWMEDSIHDVPIQRPAEVAQVIKDAATEGFFGR